MEDRSQVQMFQPTTNVSTEQLTTILAETITKQFLGTIIFVMIVVIISKLGVSQRPLTLILRQKYRDTNGRRIVIQISGAYATFCQEGGILLQKHGNRNGRCIAILFTSIGVRGRFDSSDKSSSTRTYSLQYCCHWFVPVCKRTCEGICFVKRLFCNYYKIESANIFVLKSIICDNLGCHGIHMIHDQADGRSQVFTS